MKYNAPFGATDANAPFVNGDPTTGQRGSIPPAAAFETPQREIVAVITAAGLTPTNNDLTQLSKALAILRTARFAQDTGRINKVVVAPSPGYSSYTAGQSLLVKIANTNLGPATINVSDLGERDIIRVDGDPLEPGDLQRDGLALLAYDGAAYQLISLGADSQFDIAASLRPYSVAVISASVLAPPPTPAAGATYLVPANATGAWSGSTNLVTQWDGARWVFVDYPEMSVIGVADTGDLLKRTSTGWRSAYATAAEASARTSRNTVISPKTLGDELDKRLPRFTESSQAPANPVIGDRWWDPDVGVTYSRTPNGGNPIWLQTTF